MIATLSRRTSIFLGLSLLSPIPTVLRAAELSLGEIATAIKDLVIFMIKRGDLETREKRKASAALIGARMIRIAAMKRIFADYLQGKPATMSEFSPHDQMLVDQELRRIDREIANFAEDLREIDPAWATKNPKLYNELFAIGHGKGLWWAVRFERYGANQDVGRLRAWMYAEAKALEIAAAGIQSGLTP
jgi:hypothetical protein